MDLSTFLLVLFSVSFGVCGQILMKQGMLTLGGPVTLRLSVLPAMLLQPYVLLGFACYGIAAVSWLVVLSRAPLSVAYPMLSLGYVVGALLSWRLFGESMSAAKLAGLLLVSSGVILLARS